MKTMTQVLADDAQAGETLTEVIKRNQQPGETLTETQHRMQETGGGTTPPVTAPPTGFADPTASVITATGFKITWVAPTGGDAVTNYEVSVKAGSTPITGSPFTMAGTTLSKTVSGLTASTDYTVSVKAINGDGNAAAGPVTVSTIAT